MATFLCLSLELKGYLRHEKTKLFMSQKALTLRTSLTPFSKSFNELEFNNKLLVELFCIDILQLADTKRLMTIKLYLFNKFLPVKRQARKK